MAAPSFLQSLNPWHRRRAKAAAQVAALRQRDGDSCARCRRPMRFDLAAGHDQGPAVEPVMPGATGSGDPLGNLRLCHPRCSPAGVDRTEEVTLRVRRKNEAALFGKARKSRAA